MSKIPQLARDVPDPGPPPTPVKTLTRWSQFLGSIAAGEGIAESKLKHYITNADLEAVTRNDPLEMQRWQEACTAGLKRNWSVLQIKEIFGRIAEGKTIHDAQVEVMGVGNARFSQLVVEDPEMNMLYRRALEARALTVVEEVLPIVDDDSHDTLPGPKGGEIPNMAAVTRSKLRGETRLRVAGYYNARLFGERKDNVQVNVQINHAEVLEAARSRDKLRDKRITPAKLQTAIDATFAEKPAEPDEPKEDSWDTQWREEK